MTLDVGLRMPLLFFHVHHFTAFVEAAVGAHRVGQAHLAAVGSDDRVASGERVVRPAAVAPAFGGLAFRKWRHGFPCSCIVLVSYPLMSAGLYPTKCLLGGQADRLY